MSLYTVTVASPINGAPMEAKADTPNDLRQAILRKIELQECEMKTGLKYSPFVAVVLVPIAFTLAHLFPLGLVGIALLLPVYVTYASHPYNPILRMISAWRCKGVWQVEYERRYAVESTDAWSNRRL